LRDRFRRWLGEYMFALGWGEGGEAWQGRCLFAWEEELVREFSNFLSNMQLQVDKEDMWSWQLDRDNAYSVCGVYLHLTGLQTQHACELSNLIWHRDVSLKVLVFVWRLLRNRLPTKDNLVSRSVITNVAQLCTSGCSEVESSNHFILNYNIFGSFWFFVRDWLGFSLVDPRSISDHFVHYAHLTGGSRV